MTDCTLLLKFVFIMPIYFVLLMIMCLVIYKLWRLE